MGRWGGADGFFTTDSMDIFWITRMGRMMEMMRCGVVRFEGGEAMRVILG
jgi:hypothetical protein